MADDVVAAPPEVAMVASWPLDTVGRRDAIMAAAKATGFIPVFYEDPFKSTYGQLRGVRPVKSRR